MQVFPGDSIEEQTRDLDQITIGKGIMDNLKVTQPGLLKSHSDKYWIDAPTQTFFIPVVKNRIIGRIVGKMAEVYRVDIGGPRMATLDFYEFEGATKKNRPHLQNGALVYAMVKKANDFMEPEITCVNPATQRADGCGELSGGFVFRIPITFAKSVLSNQHPLLKELGSIFPFEVAVGFNGFLWVKAANTKDTFVIVRCIQEYQKVPTFGADKKSVQKLVQEIKISIE